MLCQVFTLNIKIKLKLLSTMNLSGKLDMMPANVSKRLAVRFCVCALTATEKTLVKIILKTKSNNHSQSKSFKWPFLMFFIAIYWYMIFHQSYFYCSNNHSYWPIKLLKRLTLRHKKANDTLNSHFSVPLTTSCDLINDPMA